MTRYFLILFVLVTTTTTTLAQEINIMSYNIRLDVASDGENRWDARKDKVASLMNYYEADFIGCQEVQHHQLQYLLDKLNKYNYIGVARDDGKEKGEYSCIFYNKEKFTLLQQHTFWLSSTPDIVSIGWDAACNRVCTYGLFQSNKTKQLFWVLNTHLDHMGINARIESAKLITEKINKINVEKNYPVILTGDFNAQPSDEPIQYISNNMQNTRAISNQPAYGPVDTWNGFQFDQKPTGCIDYIFINKHPKIRAKKFATITDSYDKKYPSDHFPVLAGLIINN
ncbi:MAG TPA: endonuclease/exonuclease/phosphatase family protein [Chitinophagaceae bacterium]|nr:endonuclease/exonuclease/phosphatase family protein [Chitinophagaceae bacterium]